MSLLSFIADNRALFADHVSRPGVGPTLPTVVPRGADPAWMGCAFDYVLRFGLRARWPERAHSSRLLADKALRRLAASLDARRHRWLVRSVRRAVAGLEGLSPGARLGQEEARAALLLGRTEVFARGRGGTQELKQWVEGPSQEQVDELVALYGLVSWEAFEPQELLALNPTFNEGSRLLGGADADLVVDDLLVDIKTVSQPSLRVDDVRQVVGYALLANQFGISGFDGPVEIRRVGIWFSRSGELVSFDLDEVCSAKSRAVLLEAMTAG